jgi:beta-N-acetylhexosaminidase
MRADYSEIAAVKALLGEIPIRGHLPVTIPGLAKHGEAIQLPTREFRGQPARPLNSTVP